MRPHNPIEALVSPADIGLQARIASGEQPARRAAPNGILLRSVDTLAESILVAALLGELGLVLANVLARAYFQQSFLWADEAARLSLSILAFIGGAVAYRRRDHAFVRVVLNLVSKRGERGCLALADIVVLFVAGLTGIASAEFIASSWNERTPILQLPAAMIALPLPVGMALLVLYALANLRGEHGRMAWGVGAAFVGVMAAAAATRDFWLPQLGGDAAIFAGVPVGFVLLLATATYLWGTDAASLVVLPQTMVNGTGNFILLAVPFFILAGLIMERGGISVRLVRFVYTLVGHLRGGLLQVTVASMYVVSGLSGSKPADVAAVGTVMRDELRERHGAAEGAAVLAASAIMGETVPPSIAMLIVGILLGVATPTEVAAFAVVYGLLLSVLVYREMDLHSFLRTVTDTAALTGVLLFIFAAASGFSWTLTVAFLPQRLVALLHSVGNSTEIFMLGSIALLIVTGVLLEGLPSLNVLAPLLLPIAGSIGLSGLHYALVLIIAMGVGGFVPLAGVGFYVCCAIMRCNVEQASRAMMPYLAVVLFGLLVVAFVTWFALFLPRYFGFAG